MDVYVLQKSERGPEEQVYYGWLMERRSHTHRHKQTIKSVASSADPHVPFALCAMLLRAEQGCNSVLCLQAAVEDTKLIRLPPGG